MPPIQLEILQCLLWVVLHQKFQALFILKKFFGTSYTGLVIIVASHSFAPVTVGVKFIQLKNNKNCELQKELIE